MKISSILRLATLLTSLFVYSISPAQTPELTVKDHNGQVYLQSLKVDVKVIGNIASTTMEMQFFNKTSRILEGELVFPLPEGSTVSRYAIDINGKMREAVPVEKEKGTQVFEAIEHRRVDPGLLEKTTGNNFRTRIYPIPANGSRTVLIAYDEELKFNKNNSLRYHLPLDYKKAIYHFKLEINVLQSSFQPNFEEQPDDNIQFKEWNNNYSASIEKTDFIPGHSLSLSIPKNNDAAEVMMQQVGANYYFLLNNFIKKDSRAKQIPNEIGLIWDVSLSGLSRDLYKEMALLGAYINQKKNLRIHLATLNNEFRKINSFEIVNGNWADLKKTIEGFTYDGGTNYNKINLNALNGGEYLFFSDGISTLSDPTIAENGKPVYTINSAPKADYSLLQTTAFQTGAAFVNLNNLKIPEAVKLLTDQPLQLICIKQNGDISEVYPSISQPVINGNSVAGISTSANTLITLQYGYGNTILFEKVIALNYNKFQTTQVNLQKIWAQKKVAELDLDYNRNKALISQLSKRYTIVTRNTSLIVLENVMDYVQYEIEPPAELREAYDRIIKERLAGRQNQQTLVMNNAFNYFEELMQWWDKDYKTKPIPSNNNKQPLADSTTVSRAQNNLEEVVVTGYGTRSKREVTGSVTTINADKLDAEMEEKVAAVQSSGSPGDASNIRIRGFSSSSRDKKMDDEKNDPKYDYANIDIKAWSPDRVYLKELGKTSREKQYTRYLELRKEYISTPSFYFDMACFFYQQNDSAAGLRILSNLAELDLENHELYKLLGFKLRETGNYKEAVYVYKKIVEWRPQEPQSYRDYGLALEDAGYFQQALDTLYMAIHKQYDGTLMNNYNGIEETIVTEINQLVALHGSKLDLSGIDKKLIHAMPVDIRVVLSWNIADTDIDLWVTDPNDEKCYYSHKNTAIGGHISNDFTNGYGPEQFLLKKAIKGTYKIEVDFYGERQVRLAGPATVMAEVFTHYSDGKQERKIITVQLEKSERSNLLLGTFSFEK